MATTAALEVRVERAIDELRRGRGVVMKHDGNHEVLFGLETANLDTLLNLAETTEHALHLVITRERAMAVGHEPQPGVETFRYRWSPQDDGRWLEALALQAPASDLNGATHVLVPGEPHLASGVKLIKLAKLMPALGLLTPEKHTPRQLLEGNWCSLTSSDIEQYDTERVQGLRIVARAKIPLRGQVASEFVVFRDRAGSDDYVAIIIGDITTGNAPLVRLHSACFTGDLFGSLRCDCGSQLQQSIDAISQADGGILLYLPQEGRGIGLTNKLRAYAVQDEGFDTIEADLHLGFRADERSYQAAARMLDALGISRIRLLTNSPQKMEALRDSGITIDDRVALTTIPNPHNKPYLQAKVAKAGHWINDI